MNTSIETIEEPSWD